MIFLFEVLAALVAGLLLWVVERLFPPSKNK